MREIEVKVLDIDRGEIERKLIALGAEKIFDGELHAIWFDTPDEQLRAHGTTFRLRKEGDIIRLGTKHGKRKNAVKDLEETEVVVQDFSQTQKILEIIGFRTIRTLDKHRTSYVLGDVHIDIDKYDAIPEFLEIEGPNAAAVLAFASRLGFSKEDCKNWGVKKLFEHYGKKI